MAPSTEEFSTFFAKDNKKWAQRTPTQDLQEIAVGFLHGHLRVADEMVTTTMEERWGREVLTQEEGAQTDKTAPRKEINGEEMS